MAAEEEQSDLEISGKVVLATAWVFIFYKGVL